MATRSTVVGWKWVTTEGFSWYDGKFGPWLVGAKFVVEDAKPNGPCGRGIHIGKTAASAIGYGKFPGRLLRVAALGPVLGQDDTKWRVGGARVLEELKKPSWVSKTEAFIDSIKTVAFFRPSHAPLKAWRHHQTGAAAGTVAWEAARDAARTAAWDAGLAANMAVVSDINFPNAKKHHAHIRARWKVWQMGYGLYCDVNGVLYTYERP